MDAHTFLESIICGVTANPSDVSIQQSNDDRGILFRVRVSKIDMPRLIGKKGQNIAALRLIMKLYAADGPNISVIVEEPNK